MDNDRFETGPIYKVYFAFVLPVVFGKVISLIYNMADTYFVAATGNTDLVAGISLTTPIFTLLMAMGNIFALGGSSVISRLFGQRRDADGKRLSALCFYASVLLGIVFAIVLFACREPVVYLLGADSDTFPYACQYVSYLALGAPFIIVSFTPLNLLRTEGFSTASMVGSVLGAVVNMILDPIFISVLGLNAAGAAIATVIGYIATDLFYVVFLLAKSQKLSISPRGLRASGGELRQILAVGIPASITNLMQSLSTALTNRCLLPYGNGMVATMGIVLKISMIAALVLVGLAFGAQPLVGYNYGARNGTRLRQVLAFCYRFSCATAVVLAIALSLAARPLLGLFLQDQTLIEAGIPMLRLQQAGTLFAAVVLVSTCTFQATGKAMDALLLSVSRQGIVYAVALLVLSQAAGYYGILCAQAVADLLSAILALVLLRKTLYREIQDMSIQATS